MELKHTLVGFGALVWISWLGAILALSWILSGANIWKTWEYDPGPWCEREHTLDLIREPSNSYSDFSFLAVGIFMIMVRILYAYY